MDSKVETMISVQDNFCLENSLSISLSDTFIAMQDLQFEYDLW